VAINIGSTLGWTSTHVILSGTTFCAWSALIRNASMRSKNLQLRRKQRTYTFDYSQFRNFQIKE
jgi:hypothetical protein